MPILTNATEYDRYSNDLICVQPVTLSVPFTSDTMMLSDNPTTNYSTNVALGVGEYNAGTSIRRTLISPNYSLIPAGRTILSARLRLVPVADYSSNARTMYCHRVLRNVICAQATQNVFSTLSTGNNWGTPGCSNPTTDYDGAVVIGSMDVPASPTLNAEMFMTLDASEVQKLYDGTYTATATSLLLFVSTQNADLIHYASTDNATEAYRPYLEATYI
jgi:hypothetical protein